jgi:3D (Asp-Asp-Asp) domain-containing protein
MCKAVSVSLGFACILAFSSVIDPSIKTNFPKRYLCTVTFYTPSVDETDDTPFITASGQRVRPGICAISRDLEKLGFTFGRTIYVEDLGSFEIQDRMHTRWKKRIDILVMSKKRARSLGKIKNASVILLEPTTPFATQTRATPFDVWNYVITTVLFSIVLTPAIGTSALYQRLKKRSDNIQYYSETAGSMEKAIYLEQTQKRTMLPRRGRKMKLQALYTKDAKGFIKVVIEVIESGDFPTVNVFKSSSENRSDEAWNLGEGAENTTSKTLPSSDEAKRWVSSQVKALEEKLNQWRHIVVPEPEEFEV